MNSELNLLQRELDKEYGVYLAERENLKASLIKCNDIQDRQDQLALLTGYFNKLVDTKRKEVMDKITNIVTYGLQSIFKNPTMKLVVKEKLQRNQKFYTLSVSIDGVETDDWTSASGGVIDVTSFMLRVVLLAISSNRRFLVLDEPFKGLSKGYRENLGDFLKLLSEKMNIQFFIVSHQDEIDQAATNLFDIRFIDGKSTIVPERTM